MTRVASRPEHPGRFIRKGVIPKGISVTVAAKRLGVGRPALSNLLNGRSSLSAEMATRLEKAFGVDRNELLKLQAAFDRQEQMAGQKDISVHPYVPSFLKIKSRDIDHWAGGIDARQRLPVLIRMLIISTHDALRRVAIPGYDDAQRTGWDGMVEAHSVTPWIPQGSSYWEFGTSRDPRKKADTDYRESLKKSVPFGHREESSFIFVTPRRWPGATGWAAAKQREGRWKEVRALEASDLETWLAQSVPGQTWLAEQLGMATDGVETLDRFWHKWSSASSPSLTPEVFRPSVDAYRPELKSWLASKPDRPFVVAADSKDEAIAFLACLFRSLMADAEVDPKVTLSADLAAVFHSAASLQELIGSRTRFLPIVHSEATERALAPVHRGLHSITVRPRNAIESEPDIALDLLTHEAFRAATDSMGIDPDRAERLEQESGRSPTILRRRLATVPAIRRPLWAGEEANARALMPMALVGAWNGGSTADQQVLETLAGTPYDEVDKNIVRLLNLDDSPVWAVGQHGGVASRIDALFGIKRYFTKGELATFFTVAEHVLSEVDPALELPENKRWTAGLHGRVREHSAALRRGICETLVILAVHGNDLVPEWVETTLEAQVSSLIRSLLTPLTLGKLRSHNDDLPRYAEAAPDLFLRLVEEDLRRAHPVTLGLFKPDGSGIFDYGRTGILWALESLAWKHLGRVSAILGRMSETVIDDNLRNKPINSLKAIYRSWIPQTSAPLGERKMAISALAKRFPEVAWQVCIDQVPTGRSQIGDHSRRPLWRDDATGAGRGVTLQERWDFTRHVLAILHEWPIVDEKKLGQLVERVEWMPEGDQDAVWRRITKWNETEADDCARAALRERIRQCALTHTGGSREVAKGTVEAARQAFAILRPHDLVCRHEWLFADHWIEPSADDVEGDGSSYSSGQAVIRQQREDAMLEIWRTHGHDGVFALLAGRARADDVGEALAPTISDTRERARFVVRCLESSSDLADKVDACVSGVLRGLSPEELDSLISAVALEDDPAQMARLLRCAPFRQSTWQVVARSGPQVEDSYWADVRPRREEHSASQVTELIDRLLRSGRPQAAFWIARLDWSLVETSQLQRLLLAIATTKPWPSDRYMSVAFSIGRALDSLDGRTGVSLDDMATLEFLYSEVLERTEHGMPNLERQLASSPGLFFRLLTQAFRRRDRGQDPAEWRIEDPERAAVVGSRALRLLYRVKQLPGMGDDGKVDLDALFNWVDDVRRLCAEHCRVAIGDQMIGQLLSRIDPVSEDVAWPRTEVCAALERTSTEDIGIGFRTGVYNARGVHTVGEDGEAERGLAARFRRLASRHTFEHPFVASLLEGIARQYDWEAKRRDVEGEARKRLE